MKFRNCTSKYSPILFSNYGGNLCVVLTGFLVNGYSPFSISSYIQKDEKIYIERFDDVFSKKTWFTLMIKDKKRKYFPGLF